MNKMVSRLQDYLLSAHSTSVLGIVHVYSTGLESQTVQSMYWDKYIHLLGLLVFYVLYNFDKQFVNHIQGGGGGQIALSSQVPSEI